MPKPKNSYTLSELAQKFNEQVMTEEHFHAEFSAKARQKMQNLGYIEKVPSQSYDYMKNLPPFVNPPPPKPAYYKLTLKARNKLTKITPQGYWKLDLNTFISWPREKIDWTDAEAKAFVEKQLSQRALQNGLLIKAHNVEGDIKTGFSYGKIEFYPARYQRLGEDLTIKFDFVRHENNPAGLIKTARVYDGKNEFFKKLYYQQLIDRPPQGSFDDIKNQVIEVFERQEKLSFEKYSRATTQVCKRITSITFRSLPVIGVGLAVSDVARSEDKFNTGVNEATQFSGGITGAALGARLGAPLGPLGIVAGGVLGGYLGAESGGMAHKTLLKQVQPEPTKPPAVYNFFSKEQGSFGRMADGLSLQSPSANIEQLIQNKVEASTPETVFEQFDDETLEIIQTKGTPQQKKWVSYINRIRTSKTRDEQHIQEVMKLKDARDRSDALLDYSSTLQDSAYMLSEAAAAFAQRGNQDMARFAGGLGAGATIGAGFMLAASGNMLLGVGMAINGIVGFHALFADDNEDPMARIEATLAFYQLYLEHIYQGVQHLIELGYRIDEHVLKGFEQMREEHKLLLKIMRLNDNQVIYESRMIREGVDELVDAPFETVMAIGNSYGKGRAMPMSDISKDKYQTLMIDTARLAVKAHSAYLNGAATYTLRTDVYANFNEVNQLSQTGKGFGYFTQKLMPELASKQFNTNFWLPLAWQLWRFSELSFDGEGDALDYNATVNLAQILEQGKAQLQALIELKEHKGLIQQNLQSAIKMADFVINRFSDYPEDVKMLVDIESWQNRTKPQSPEALYGMPGNMQICYPRGYPGRVKIKDENHLHAVVRDSIFYGLERVGLGRFTVDYYSLDPDHRLNVRVKTKGVPGPGTLYDGPCMYGPYPLVDFIYNNDETRIHFSKQVRAYVIETQLLDINHSVEEAKKVLNQFRQDSIQAHLNNITEYAESWSKTTYFNLVETREACLVFGYPSVLCHSIPHYLLNETLWTKPYVDDFKNNSDYTAALPVNPELSALREFRDKAQDVLNDFNTKEYTLDNNPSEQDIKTVIELVESQIERLKTRPKPVSRKRLLQNNLENQINALQATVLQQTEHIEQLTKAVSDLTALAQAGQSNVLSSSQFKQIMAILMAERGPQPQSSAPQFKPGGIFAKASLHGQEEAWSCVVHSRYKNIAQCIQDDRIRYVHQFDATLAWSDTHGFAPVCERLSNALRCSGDEIEYYEFQRPNEIPPPSKLSVFGYATAQGFASTTSLEAAGEFLRLYFNASKEQANDVKWLFNIIIVLYTADSWMRMLQGSIIADTAQRTFKKWGISAQKAHIAANAISFFVMKSETFLNNPLLEAGVLAAYLMGAQCGLWFVNWMVSALNKQDSRKEVYCGVRLD